MKNTNNILETERLYLREMTYDDYDSLCKMLKDKDVMYAYEHAFSEEESRDWLEKQMARYKNDGFGLWAVILKESGEMIGQCGLTMQEVNSNKVPEVGYLFIKNYWHKGFATEAAIASKEYAFNKLGFDEVFSIIRENNISSQNVAKRNGMTVCDKVTKHYYDMDMPHLIYSVKNVK